MRHFLIEICDEVAGNSELPEVGSRLGDAQADCVPQMDSCLQSHQCRVLCLIPTRFGIATKPLENFKSQWAMLIFI